MQKEDWLNQQQKRKNYKPKELIQLVKELYQRGYKVEVIIQYLKQFKNTSLSRSQVYNLLKKVEDTINPSLTKPATTRSVVAKIEIEDEKQKAMNYFISQTNKIIQESEN